ncbi:hypothetical protein [Thiocystis violascens]|uniref:Uncharacterized protein n=1 Tax=Thiocystis violascens (strain ATCC 17096 / DSM 198 / 6111) TaxID=765911 RepID=I3YGR9_THIV6|nr:hypothetical protein [Thiocystis violascens]AFL76187.1 hypothetical protein Thivi_4383 [Thiocystis violascens DSM 198]
MTTPELDSASIKPRIRAESATKSPAPSGARAVCFLARETVYSSAYRNEKLYERD